MGKPFFTAPSFLFIILEEFLSNIRNGLHMAGNLFVGHLCGRLLKSRKRKKCFLFEEILR